MNRFKVGDTVIAKRSALGLKQGERCTVTELAVPSGEYNQIPWVMLKDKRHPYSVDGSFREDEFEPAVGGTFKVGDRVRVTDPNLLRHGTPVGALGTIKEVGNTYLLFDLEHPRDGLVEQMLSDPHEYLEPVAVAASNSNTEPPLTIEAGKFYKTRDGRKVGPMEICGTGLFNVPYDIDGRLWHEDGERYSRNNDHDDLIAEWPTATTHDNASTAGFTVPVFDEDDFDICGHRDSDDDIVQLSVSELTAALADSLKVARKVGKTIKRGDLVILARPALVTGVDRYHASVQTDGGNYSLPIAALTAA